MDRKILLDQILQRLITERLSQFDNYNSFEYLGHNAGQVTIRWEKGTDARLPFDKILLAIAAYQKILSVRLWSRCTAPALHHAY